MKTGNRTLVDSNSYFRLAQSLHPLLGRPFGKSDLYLYLNKYLDRQFNKSTRLASKFFWVTDEEYTENRKRGIIILKKSQSEEIESAYDYLWETQKELKLSLLYDDIYCLAYSIVLNIPVVTDDSGMHILAKEYDIKIYTTLELLSVLYNDDAIDDEKVMEIVGYWQYNSDLPKNFQTDFKRLFPQIKL